MQINKHTFKTVVFSTVTLLLLFSVWYFVVSTIYYHGLLKEPSLHLFDPYLQISSPLFDRKTANKENGVFRILCLGGSTVEDYLVPPQDRWPEIIKVILKEHYPGIRIEVLNAGQQWHTTKHSLINYVTYYRDWNPDLVIIMHGINDLYRSFSPDAFAIGEYNDRWTHFYGPAIAGAKGYKGMTFEQYLCERLRRLRRSLYDRLSVRAKNNIKVLMGRAQHIRMVNYSLERYSSLIVSERHLKTLVECIHRDKVEALLITQPFLYKPVMRAEEFNKLWYGLAFCSTKYRIGKKEEVEFPSPESLYNAMNAFNGSVKKIASSEGAFLVDAESYINKDLHNFTDDVHFNIPGSQSLAELVARKIIETDIISQRVRNHGQEKD